MGKLRNEEKILLTVLGLAIIGFLFLTFEGLTYSLVNVGGEAEVMVNSEQTYKIDMRVTPTSQFKTEVSERMQFGQWNVIDEDNNTVIKGRTTTLSNGSYLRDVTVIIPPGYKTLYFQVWITETQRNLVDDEWIEVDIGKILKDETLTINIIECQVHSDCNEPGLCTGKYGWCGEENTCEILGECEECITNEDCGEGLCQDYTCYLELKEEVIPFVQQVQDTFGTGLTETSNASKEASSLLTFLVVVMGATLTILIYRRNKK